MSKDKLSFWFSGQHAKHYASINRTSFDPTWKCHKNKVGDVLYTACTERPNATEPFEGALETFPDYVKVADGTTADITTEGLW